MWTWSLNWGEITPEIVIGTCPMSPDDLESIQAGAKVSAVLSLQQDDCLAYGGIDYARMEHAGAELGLTMTRCPIRDFGIADQRRRLPEVVRALAHLQAHGHRTYVHCTAGLGRAPLVVLGYLTMVGGRSPDEVIGRILAGRAGAVPAWEAYHGCRQDLVACHREEIARRAYELYEQGVHGDAHADWCQAEANVLRTVVVGRRLTV